MGGLFLPTWVNRRLPEQETFNLYKPVSSIFPSIFFFLLQLPIFDLFYPPLLSTSSTSSIPHSIKHLSSIKSSIISQSHPSST
jgi:hypothetical protein